MFILSWATLGWGRTRLKLCTYPNYFVQIRSYDRFQGYSYQTEPDSNMVARFILQLPKSASMVAGYLDEGLKPFSWRIFEQTCLLVWKMENSFDCLL